MELTGKIIKVNDLETGVGKNGNGWKKKTFVIETIEQYPRKVFCTLFNNNADIPVTVGNYVTAYFDLNSREYNGKWYTDVSVWKVEMQAPPTDKPVTPMPKAEPIKAPDPSTVDSLPF